MQISTHAPRNAENSSEINRLRQLATIAGSTAIDFVLRIHPHEISIYDKNCDRLFLSSLAQSALRKHEASSAAGDPCFPRVGLGESHLRTNIKV